MTTLSFTFSSTGLYYVALTGTKQDPALVTKGKIALPANHTPAQLTGWYENQLKMLLNGHHPDKVSYKLSVSRVTNKMVHLTYYGQAVLNLLCHKDNIAINHTSSSAIVPSKFGQSKETNLQTYINERIGSHPPHWDATMKDTALMALIILD